MMQRKKLVAALATVAALAATGTASAAATGSTTPPPSPTKSSAPAGDAGDASGKPGKSVETGQDEFAAMAAKLGVTTDRLDAAMIAAKTSLAGTNGGSPQAFYDAIAANLGVPVQRVQDALGTGVFRKDPGSGQPSKQGVPGPSPFTTDSAAAFLAHELGVDQAKAKTALAALMVLGDKPGGIDPSAKAFGDIASSLGVSSGQLANGLDQLKMSLAGKG